jgi:hypothetical protein
MSAVELAGGVARFIGPGRQWGGGEVADGSGVLIPVGFKGVKGEEETRRHRLDGELEGDDPSLEFDFTWVRERSFVGTWRGGVDRRAAVAWLETARGGRRVGKRAEWAAQAGRPTGPVRGFRAGRGRRV